MLTGVFSVSHKLAVSYLMLHINRHFVQKQEGEVWELLDLEPVSPNVSEPGGFLKLFPPPSG